MKVLVHDFSGHPFQVQLSRELACLGYAVVHAYDANFLTPHGDLQKRANDSPNFAVVPLSSGGALEKSALFTRWRQEHAYGKVLAAFIKDQSPDVVISANTPLISQGYALEASRGLGAKFVFWLQDLYGVGIKRALTRRIPVLGPLLGSHFERKEQRLLVRSDAVVAISDDFVSYALEIGVSPEKVWLVENWAPLEDFEKYSKHTTWKDRHGLAGKFIFLYSGTLGYKHNPQLLLSLAIAFADDPNVAIVVVSEGPAALWLREMKDAYGLKNLHLFNFQPYEELPGMLCGSDVLLAILEPEASSFAVPSKVLTYICAGRPVLGFNANR